MEEYRIIKALSGFYYVQTEDGVVECRARGRFRRQDQSPLVGDFVRITRQRDKGVLEALLPRKNAFIRPAVANIDQLVVLASCAIPVTEPFLIDRVLAIAQLQNVPALVVVNKDDLAPAQPLAEIYRRAGVPVLVTSAETGEGIEALREALAGKLSCLTGNSGVGKSSLLNRTCPQLQLPVGEVSEKLGVKGIPAGAEDCGTAREIALAAALNEPIHICHVSTKTSVALIRDAKRRGVKVTAETAPHYVSLTDRELLRGDADYRMNPPLRTQADVDEIINGLCDGTLDAIATDHAPHTPEEKADFVKAPNGSIGMETSFAVCNTYLVKTGRMTLSQLVEKMSVNPARILKINAGTLSVGANADVVLINPDEEWTVDAGKLHGKSKNTPFKGRTLTGKVKKTILGGKVVFED